jgi:hypothetical protein
MFLSSLYAQTPTVRLMGVAPRVIFSCSDAMKKRTPTHAYQENSGVSAIPTMRGASVWARSLSDGVSFGAEEAGQALQVAPRNSYVLSERSHGTNLSILSPSSEVEGSAVSYKHEGSA